MAVWAEQHSVSLGRASTGGIAVNPSVDREEVNGHMIGQVSAAVIRFLNRLGRIDFRFRYKRTKTSSELETDLSIMGDRNRSA
jgi:hypothetical protein